MMPHRQSSHIWRRLIALQGALVLAACVHVASNRRPETLEERAQSVAVAAGDVTEARCELEQRCGNVGPGQKFDSRPVCESKMHGETTSALNLKDCPLGVEPRKLDSCVASILAQDCGSPFDALNRWNACRVGQICYQ
jgi:hypothetical protein